MKCSTLLMKVHLQQADKITDNYLDVPLNEDCERTVAPLELVKLSLLLSKCVLKLIRGQLFSKDRHLSGRCGG
jgi:hypothetical protein